ncbi:universal stress protein [Mycetocola miduiensis]|uniref:universal stress protein n=1 Tax=Mycetocola miduiensis TaxID=995034 RepID=UPI000B845E5B
MTDSTSKRHVVVGVDGSESSVDALREAAEIAEALGVRLEAVMTWEYPVIGDYRPIPLPSPEEEARTILTEAITHAFDGAPPQYLSTTTAPGPAAKTLIELSKDARPGQQRSWRAGRRAARLGERRLRGTRELSRSGRPPPTCSAGSASDAEEFPHRQSRVTTVEHRVRESDRHALGL